MDGKQFNTSIIIGGTMSFLVKEVTAEGYDMEVRYLGLSMNMKMPAHSLNADTEHPDKSDPFSLILSSLINKPFMLNHCLKECLNSFLPLMKKQSKTSASN
jgi:hypothetical protein